MINTSLLIYILHIGKLFNLPSDITYRIYFNIIHDSAQLIIDKWFSFINIHNTNLCYIVNNIPILQGYNFFGDIVTYYDLHDIKFNITLSICAKYFKASISDKEWWLQFIQNGFNGLTFVNNENDYIVLYNLYFLHYILGCFQ